MFYRSQIKYKKSDNIFYDTIIWKLDKNNHDEYVIGNSIKYI